MLKVLHINTEKTWRGGERQLFLQFKYSSKTVNYLVCRKESAVSSRIGPLAENAFELPMRSGLNIFSSFKLAAICKAEGIDVVHAHSPKALSIAFIASLFSKLRIVTTKRTIFPVRSNWLTKRKYQACDLIVCVSKKSREVLLQSLSNARTKVVPSAIESIRNVENLKIPEGLKIHAGKQKIGYVAALTKEKNIDSFLSVAQKIISKRKDVVFIWIGDGHLKKEVQSSIDAEELSDNIILVGFQRDVHHWMGHLDILFFPSASEGFPTTILDSFQLGVPVVASNVGGIPDIIDHGQNGLLCDPFDVEGFEENILSLLNDSNVAATLRDKGLDSFKQHLAEYRIPQIEKTYSDILG